MRTLVVGVGDYSLDGVIGEASGPFFNFCRSVPDDPEHAAWTYDSQRRADVHIFGRVTYEVFASYFPNVTDDPTADILNKGRKVVFPAPSTTRTGRTRRSPAVTSSRRSRN